ncbi:MAG TPA: TonB-dependent receptor plug domain-containing protein [Kofleriaceae bacterium]|jgi:hypothetical protein
MGRAPPLTIALLAICARAHADDGSNAPPAAQTEPTASPSAPASAGETIEIRGTLPDPGSTVVTGAEARQIPGALDDPIRGLVALPGFVPLDPGTPYLYLRGAQPANIEYLIDGVRVPLLFHDSVISSVIPAALVQAIDVYPSAVPARFGGVAGGVIELDTRPPATELHGVADVKWYETGALVESPLDGGGTLLAAARIGYPTAIIQIFDPAVQKSFWDYQARTTWKLGDHDRVGLFAFGSHDRSAENENDEPVNDLTSDFHRLDVRYDHDFGNRGHVRIAATGGWSSVGAAGDQVADWSYGARLEGELRIADPIKLRFGARLDRDMYSVASSSGMDPAAGSPADSVPTPSNLVGFANVDAVWDVTHDLQVVPGVRVGYLRSLRENASSSSPVAEPTLAARYRIMPGLTSVTSFGIADQLPTLRVGGAPSFAVSIPGFPIGDAKLQHSIAGAQGLEVILPAAIVATATAYATHVRDASDLPAGELVNPASSVPSFADSRADEWNYGLEVSVKRLLTEHLAGLLSYTLSKTTDRYADGTTQLGPYDRRHVLSAVLAYNLSRHWRGGVRAVLFTGTPVLTDTPTHGHATETGTDQPIYYGVDVRFERRWAFDHDRSLSLVIELLNLALSQFQTMQDCNPQPGAMCSSSSSGNAAPIPSIGVEGTF